MPQMKPMNWIMTLAMIMITMMNFITHVNSNQILLKHKASTKKTNKTMKW